MTLNKTLANIIFGSILASLFIPFIVANNMFFPFITGKGFVFRIGMEIIFALWIVLALRDRSYLPRFSWILGTFAIFLGVMGVANFFGVYPYKSFWSNFERMDGYITLIHVFMYFVVTSAVLTTKKHWNIFFATSVSASVLMCVYGFLQLGGSIKINQGGVRLDGTLGNAIYLAAYMLFNMFFAAYLWIQSRWPGVVRHSVFAVVILLQGIILYYTASRGVILGLIGGAFLSALLIAIFEKENKKLRRHALIGVAAVLVLIGGFFLARNTEFVTQSQTLGRFSSLSFDEIKNQGRYFIWPMAIQGFQERPLLGWGQEGFNYVFNKYYDARMYNQEAWFDRTHNVFLDWLVAGGVLGLGAYLALLIAVMVSVWRSSCGVREKALLTGLVAAYVFQNIFAFDNITSYLLFFAIVAFLHADRVREKAPLPWLDRATNMFRSGSAENQQTFQGLAGAVVLVVLVISLYFVNVKPISANLELLRALDPGRSTAVQSIGRFKNVFAKNTFASAEAREQMYVALPQFQREEMPEATRIAFETLGTAELKKQVERTPQDTRYLLFLGSFLNRTRDFMGAIPYLERAAETSPQKQAVLFELAVSHINLKQYDQALAIFKKAFDAEPRFQDARIFYGIGALYAGKDALAQEILAPIDARERAFDERILSAYVTMSRWDRVIPIMKERVRFDDKNPQAYFSLAAAYLKAGDRFSAIAELQRAKAINPELVGAQVDALVQEIRAGKSF